MTRRTTGFLAMALAALASLEVLLGLWAFRARVDDGDWAAVRDWLARRTEDEPLFLASSWLGPRARMELPALRKWSTVAPPDLRGLISFWVLGVGDDWSNHLQEDLEDLPPPVVTDAFDLGAFTLSHYQQTRADRIEWDLTSESILQRLEVSVDGRTCRGNRGRWRCGGERIELRTEEIDFRPRRCLAFEVGDGSRVNLRLPRASLGNALRGHVGFSDFNGRLRSDVPLGLTVTIDGHARADFIVTDDEGWAPVAVATPEGIHDLSLEVQIAASGTWHQGRYQAERRRVACLEFRGFQEDAK